MISKSIKLFLFLLSLLMLLPVRAVLADTGPKPTMEFAFKRETTGEPLTIVSGILYECDQPDCSDAAPLEELGPQRLYCEAQSCRAIGYGFAPFSMLEIRFSDGMMRRSNIFEQAGFDSYYTVYVRPDDLYVEARFSPEMIPTWVMFLIACVCVFSAVGLFTGLILFLRRRSKKT
jgi:hypothetical protein